MTGTDDGQPLRGRRDDGIAPLNQVLTALATLLLGAGAVGGLTPLGSVVGDDVGRYVCLALQLFGADTACAPAPTAERVGATPPFTPDAVDASGAAVVGADDGGADGKGVKPTAGKAARPCLGALPPARTQTVRNRVQGPVLRGQQPDGWFWSQDHKAVLGIDGEPRRDAAGNPVPDPGVTLAQTAYWRYPSGATAEVSAGTPRALFSGGPQGWSGSGTCTGKVTVVPDPLAEAVKAGIDGVRKVFQGDQTKIEIVDGPAPFGYVRLSSGAVFRGVSFTYAPNPFTGEPQSEMVLEETIRTALGDITVRQRLVRVHTGRGIVPGPHGGAGVGIPHDVLSNGQFNTGLNQYYPPDKPLISFRGKAGIATPFKLQNDGFNVSGPTGPSPAGDYFAGTVVAEPNGNIGIFPPGTGGGISVGANGQFNQTIVWSVDDVPTPVPDVGAPAIGPEVGRRDQQPGR